jgi:hypothetical protein
VPKQLPGDQVRLQIEFDSGPLAGMLRIDQQLAVKK